MTKRTAPFFPAGRERAVRMVRDHESEHGSQWSAIQSIAAKIGYLTSITNPLTPVSHSSHRNIQSEGIVVRDGTVERCQRFVYQHQPAFDIP